MPRSRQSFHLVGVVTAPLLIRRVHPELLPDGWARGVADAPTTNSAMAVAVRCICHPRKTGYVRRFAASPWARRYAAKVRTRLPARA